MNQKIFLLINEYSFIYWQRRMLQLFIIFLPFINFPIKLPLIGNSLTFLFLLIGYTLFFLELISIPAKLTKYEKYSFIFLSLYLIWDMITGFVGVLSYQYYHFLDISQDAKLSAIYFNLNQWGAFDSLVITKFWMIFLSVRGNILNVLYTYGITLWIIHMYKDNYELAFNDIQKAVRLLCMIICSYSIIEVGYLCGSYLCKNILISINPLFMKIAYINDWWPPLLWTHLQVRSIFAEPSFLGMFLAMAIPLLSNSFFKEKGNILNFFIYFFLVMLLAMTKARTATVLFIGEMLLILIWQLVIKKSAWKNFFQFVVSTVLALLLGLFCLFQFQSIDSKVGQENNTSVQSYVSQNITSVVGNQRSNSARKSSTVAMTKVGLANPFFGVGNGLIHLYLADYLTEEDLANQEVNKWTSDLKEKGIFKSGYPILNQLSWSFANQGLLGVLIFLFPIFFSIKNIFPLKKKLKNFQEASIVIAFLGLILAFLSNAAQLEYYVLGGLMLCMIFYKDEDNNTKNEGV